MATSHLTGNRNSTPESSSGGSTLRPPSSRAVGSGHHLRASADMAAFPPSPMSSRVRPSSEVYPNQSQQQAQMGNQDDAADKAAQQWIADIDQYTVTLEEMAAATLDQDFKDELSAIEQWFRVLSEAERTAALYALLQQTTQVQIRFFIQVLKQMSKSHPMSGFLSPANFENDAMSNRLSDAMNRLSVDASRNSMGRPPASPGLTAGNKRHSALDPNAINAMFPDAAAALASQRAKYIQDHGRAPESNRNSAILENRSSLAAPSIQAPSTKDNMNQQPGSPWAPRLTNEQQPPVARPKSSLDHQQPNTSQPGQSQGQAPMGQFSQPPPSAGLRSPRPQPASSGSMQTTTVTADNHGNDLPALSPYNPSHANWASMVNTPMVSSFNQPSQQQQQQQSQSQGQPGQQGSGNNAGMLANAAAMKLAALSTVNNRIMLDDARKFRRGRSTEGKANANQAQQPLSPGLPNTGIPGANLVMVNEQGQVLNQQQIAALQAQQAAAANGRRSRPNSPGISISAAPPMNGMNFTSPQANGYLSAYDPHSPLLNSQPTTLAGLNMSHFGAQAGGGGSHEGYLSDHSDMTRGRSPRGRRGSSKPPEDPTDIKLLQDIPAWLRQLRLHKYTDNLKDLNWEELVELDHPELEERGVTALGARRKLIKVFEQVREAKEAGTL